MLPASDLFNRFLLHARHVLRAVASGRRVAALPLAGAAARGRRMPRAASGRAGARRASRGGALAGCCDDRRGGRLRCMRGLELA